MFIGLPSRLIDKKLWSFNLLNSGGGCITRGIPTIPTTRSVQIYGPPTRLSIHSCLNLMTELDCGRGAKTIKPKKKIPTVEVGIFVFARRRTDLSKTARTLRRAYSPRTRIAHL